MAEQQEKQIQKAEKEIAKEIAETEEKLDKGKITEKQAEKEIKKEVKEEVEKASKKTEEEKKKKETKTEKKKTSKEAIIKGKDVPLSKKHCMAVCRMIRGKKLEKAMQLLEKAGRMEIAVPMKGEIPHRKGNIMSGRYPVTAIKQFIKMLKQLSANATNNDLDLEKGIIECNADQASRPYRRFGRMKFKRAHVTLRLVIKNKQKKK
jgi:large subunit ribosomal protein L22